MKRIRTPRSAHQNVRSQFSVQGIIECIDESLLMLHNHIKALDKYIETRANEYAMFVECAIAVSRCHTRWGKLRAARAFKCALFLSVPYKNLEECYNDYSALREGRLGPTIEQILQCKREIRLSRSLLKMVCKIQCCNHHQH